MKLYPKLEFICVETKIIYNFKSNIQSKVFNYLLTKLFVLHLNSFVCLNIDYSNMISLTRKIPNNIMDKIVYSNL